MNKAKKQKNVLHSGKCYREKKKTKTNQEAGNRWVGKTAVLNKVVGIASVTKCRLSKDL